MNVATTMGVETQRVIWDATVFTQTEDKRQFTLEDVETPKGDLSN